MHKYGIIKARLGALALLLATIVGFPAYGADIVFKFAHEAPETEIKGQSAKRFAELVAKYTDNSVRIEVFPAGQLVPTVEELRAAARGQVDIVAPYNSYFSALDPAWDVFFQPMLFDSSERAMATLSGPIGRELLGRLSSRGFVGLAIWHAGPVYIFARDKEKPIVNPEDLRGRKVRVAASKPTEAMLAKLGAVAQSMPAPEVYLALQQGVVDSVVTTPTFIGPAKWTEVLNAGTRMLWGFGGYGMIINKKSFEKMSDAQRQGFMRAVKETEEWNQQQTAKNISSSELAVAAGGLKWIDLDASQKAAWVNAAKSVWDAQSPETKALINEVNKTR